MLADVRARGATDRVRSADNDTSDADICVCGEGGLVGCERESEVKTGMMLMAMVRSEHFHARLIEVDALKAWINTCPLHI